MTPTITTRRVPLTDLHEDPGNVRKHGAKNLAAIRSSLIRFGQVEPLVVQAGTGRVIGGNGRLAVMRELGWTEAVIVDVAVDDTQGAALGIALNRTGELAEWDEDGLAKMLHAFEAAGVNANEIGFDDKDLKKILATFDVASDLGDDDAVEPPETPTTHRGDLWILGGHRLLCGDSTNADAVHRALGDHTPFLMVTDPPYGVEYDAAWRNRVGLSDSLQIGKVANDDRASWAAAFRHFRGDVAYVWHAGLFASAVERSLDVVGLKVRQQIVWMKQRFAISRGAYHWRHEPCWYAVRKGETARWAGGRKQDSVWADIVDLPDQQRRELFASRIDDCQVLAFDGSVTTVWELRHDAPTGGGHSTQKPIECMARPIRNHGASGDLVYDPFLGTGTTVIACERTGRACLGMEIDPRYVDAALIRWQNATGQEATLDGDGRSFATIAEERATIATDD